ncbi:MAG: hypothetical protein A2008_01595 [Candidatus Wallbacteria bacterium GWC2_49_35]|uniref:NfeD-like C-terminal domain-containing protein n=1 Tax=Candidatus Wallbacteria bacterium GWC2_49_35 TaxID=1817813 RepID=A0A1F7WG01_9BACT|nr:MAG: hypothetical protein A2008_01595 [Candidatus Wallbacteria bacterium GWC2_49_35]HBC73913.1 hypothetical protein [Candidatus Wallbacteria bacterium]
MLEAILGPIYTFSFVLGLGFAVISAVFSSFSGDSDVHQGDMVSSHELVHGGHEADHDAGHDAGGAEHGDSNLTTPSILSPMTISVFATSFGGFGICWQKVFGNNFAPMGAVAGVIFAVVVAVFTFYVFALIFRETQSTSNVRLDDMIGLPGDMTVGINDENPIGQVVFAAKGRRQVSMARSADGKPIEKNRKVNIIRADNNYVYVQE